MRLLLDSHIFLWWVTDSPKLGPKAREVIADPTSLVYISAATVWELSIKANLGRLDLDGADLVQEIQESGFIELPVTAQHARIAGGLPRHHEDPFDRMLISQAQVEGLILVTRDSVLSSYGVSLLEA